MLKNITNKAEYEEYKKRVANFFEREDVQNLSPIDPNWEEFFSWRFCECCKRPIGGSQIEVNGYNPKAKEIQKYTICLDCYYFAEYGQLDDRTMLKIENT